VKHDRSRLAATNKRASQESKTNPPSDSAVSCPRGVFRIAAIGLVLLPLLVLELGLRATGRAVPEASAWVELHQLKPLFVLDEDQQAWVIPPERWNYFRPASFPVKKSPQTRRVFVLGGSTVQGRPWATETAFSTWLLFQLQSADPTGDFEVINCGGVSYASYRVDKILDEVLQHQPDAIVLYTGHNEFLEDRTYAATRSMRLPNRWATAITQHVRVAAWTSRWLRGEGARRSSASPAPTAMSREVNARLDHAGGLADYHRDPPWREAVEQHFEQTLRAMIRKCQQAQVPIILCEPASDLVHTPPFKTEPLDGVPQPDSQTEDLAILRGYLMNDPAAADVHYRLGRLLYARGDTAAAIEHLTAARDADVCPLRATTPIIHATRRASHDFDVPLVRTIELLDQRDANGNRLPDGIPDPEFFVDHVHPSLAGYQRIADAIAVEFEKMGWVHRDDESLRRYHQRVAEHLATLGEDYFIRGQQRLAGLRRWAAGRAADIGFDD